MNEMSPLPTVPPEAVPLNLSRRSFLGASLGALVLGVALPAGGRAFAQEAAPAIVPGTRVNAYIQIQPDSTVLFRSAFIEGGQGIFTAMAQIVGEELDVDPTQFVVEGAPPGPDYTLIGGYRFTGGSMSVRMSYDAMRKLGAAARWMLLQAAATQLGVPMAELSTQPGRVIHAASNRSIPYGDLATAAAALPVPTDVPLRAREDFRWIGKPVARIDIRDKSTGKATYTIDLKVDGMLYGAVQHGVRLGMESGALANEDQVKAMPGVHSVHRLPGAVAVLANSWWRARRAVEALQITWVEAAPGSTVRVMPADYSSEKHLVDLKVRTGDGLAFETHGEVGPALAGAAWSSRR